MSGLGRLSEDEMDRTLKISIIIRGATKLRDSRQPQLIRALEDKIRRVVIDGSDEMFTLQEADKAAEIIDTGVRSQILDTLQIVKDPERDRNELLGRQMIAVIESHFKTDSSN